VLNWRRSRWWCWRKEWGSSSLLPNWRSFPRPSHGVPLGECGSCGTEGGHSQI
jgi:hypothetical protein